MLIIMKIPLQTISNLGIRGYFLKWPIWGGSARKRGLFQAPGILKVGVTLVKVCKTCGKSVMAVPGAFYGCEKNKKTFWFSDLFIA